MNHGLNINRLRRIRLYLLAELVNDTDNRMLTCFTVLIPDSFKNLLLAEHPSGLLRQIKKDAKFQMGQWYFRFSPEHLTLIRVDCEAGEGEHWSSIMLNSHKLWFTR